MQPKAIIIFILFAALSSPVFSMAEELTIIANKSVAASYLERDDIKQIFLGQKTLWNDGSKIIFVVQDRTKTGDAFLKTYIQKNGSQYDKFWKTQVFTGKGKAPMSFSSSFELVQFVSETPGAIGYVSSGMDIGNAKAIEVH